MLFDTDVLIWAFRGNANAAEVIDDCEVRFVSAVTYMELLQGARNREEQRSIKKFLSAMGFETLSLSEAVSHRATILMEEFTLKAGLEVADALIFSTACENSLTLCSGNHKHYRAIAGLDYQVFRP